MPFVICTGDREIKLAINNFNGHYHDGYLNVSAAAQSHLRTPSAAHANALAVQLEGVLRCWGAGQRGGPKPAAQSKIRATLNKPQLQVDLRYLAENGIASLAQPSQRRKLTRQDGSTELEKVLVRTLRILGNGLFVNAAQLTYPMKALLLLVSYMPALDQRVRAGLTRAGLAGIGPRQVQLLRQGRTRLAERKVVALAYWLGELWEREGGRLAQAAKESDHPDLARRPGRLFDVLFFVQDKGRCVIRWRGGSRRWYELPVEKPQAPR